MKPTLILINKVLMKNLNTTKLILIVILCSVFAILSFAIISNLILSKKQIVKVCQEESEVFDDYIAYCVTIAKRNFLFKSQAEIWATAGGNDEYGHMIVIDSNIEQLSNLPDTDIDWTDEGVNITFSSGHMLFIPKTFLSGGR